MRLVILSCLIFCGCGSDTDIIKSKQNEKLLAYSVEIDRKIEALKNTKINVDQGVHEFRDKLKAERLSRYLKLTLENDWYHFEDAVIKRFQINSSDLIIIDIENPNPIGLFEPEGELILFDEDGYFIDNISLYGLKENDIIQGSDGVEIGFGRRVSIKGNSTVSFKILKSINKSPSYIYYNK